MATENRITISVPGSALIVLIGVAGSGKSTFAHAHFLMTEILSSDYFRGLASDDEADQDATEDAFAALHLVLAQRMKRGKLCVVDATNVAAKYRAKLLDLARLYGRQAIAIVFETPEEICIQRAGARLGRVVNAAVIREQRAKLDGQSDEDLLAEGFQTVLRVMPDDRVEIQRM
jgi:protein phosphatase